MPSELDLVTFEILWNRLISIADEQAKALFRSSFSTAVGESEDFASTLHDREGNMIAQSVSTGTISMLTGMTKGMRVIAQKYPSDTLRPGDAIICNNPWLFSGHKYDVTIASPIFRQGQLVAWTATNLHAADIGGIGMSAAGRDTYDEGLTFPPLKLFRAGQPNDDLFDLVRENVRMPAQVIGDFYAQVAANEVGGRKLVQLMEEYGLVDLDSLSASIISRSERAARKAIAGLPDGTYRHSVQMDGFDEPLTIAVAVTVDGDRLHADFTGTSPQVDHGLNGVLNVTVGWTAHAVKSALVPEVPNNEGFFRPISASAPEGCLVNARYPAATTARHVLYMYLSGAVFGALAQAAPDRVIADSGHVTLPSLQGVSRKGGQFAYWFLVNSGMGATAHEDGLSGMSFPANVACCPVELIENVSPVFILSKEFVPDSGGAGRRRGGCDQEVVFRVRSEQPVVLSCMFERMKSPALGYLGGRDGKRGRLLLNGEPVHAKQRYIIKSSDVVTVSSGGGGGFGVPHEREPDRVLADVVSGLLSPEAAERDYGVVIEGNSINWERTEKLRAG